MEIVLLVAQALHFAAAMLLGGGVVLFPVLTGTPAPRPMVATLLTVAVAASILWLAALAVLFTGDTQAYRNPATLSAVLFGTQFGAVWRWRMGIAVLLALALPGWAWRDGRMRRAAAGVLAAAYLGSLALTGHAVRDTGIAGGLHEANQALHLLAAGSWIGGLAILLFHLSELPEGRAPQQILNRFSGIGYAAVAVIAVTGIVNIRLVAPTFSGLAGAGYGKALLIKLGLVLGMITLAAANRFALTPLLSQAPDTRRLRISIALEFALGLAVIAAAAFLGSLPPPTG